MTILSAVSSDRNQRVMTCLEKFFGVGIALRSTGSRSRPLRKTAMVGNPAHAACISQLRKSSLTPSQRPKVVGCSSGF
jgi:hypothetical protein